MKLVKLGGSVITDKNEYRKFRKETVARLCKEIKESGEDVIVVHGAGSFGHILAKKYAINGGFATKEQIPAVAQICYDVRELGLMVVKELNDAGLPSISVPPGSCFVMDERKLIIDNPEALKKIVGMKMIPVMFGDVVFDRSLGFAILSGDQIMEKLTHHFDISEVIFVSDVDGLYTADPKTNPDAALIPEVTDDVLDKVIAEMSTADVTGGVYAKMRSMIRTSTHKRGCVLINGNVEGRLLSALKGEEVPCTRVLIK